MADKHRNTVQDQIADVTECPICKEIFTNPKILPCVHTFCLHCLETYGKDKNPGDQMVCPICRKEFLIPYGGFTQLPNNFFIGKIAGIGKLASTPMSKSLCALCSEDEEVLAQSFCVDCEQNLCSRCSNGHKKSKCSQHHQVIELGSQRKPQQLNLRNGRCDHHPDEMIKMFCYEDNEAICLICCVESHQSHRFVNVNKAAGEFTEQLNTRMKIVADRLPEYEDVLQKLDKFKKEFEEDVLETEECIHDATTQLKKLIDQQEEILMQNLKLLREQNLKAIEITKLDVDRFKVIIESFSKYCEELLARGSPADVCGVANHLLTRANELEMLPANCSGGSFRCDSVSFRSSNFVGFSGQYGKNIVVGELTVTQPSHRLLTFQKEKWVSVPCESAGMEKRFLPLDLGVVDIITIYMKDKLNKIKAELQQSFGSIDTSTDEPGFVIKGNAAGVEKATNDLLKLTENVVMYDHDIDRPGIPAYFYSKHGKEVLRGIQINHKVSIQLDNTQSKAKPQTEASGGTGSCRVEVRPGKFMIVMRGDITKFGGDAIVNAANEDLKHYGGVAAAIAEAAGFNLEDDCCARVKLQGRLLPGQACVTRAGKLPCKKVIHAVGPRWSGGYKDEENILAMAVDSSLYAASEEGLKSIAMPSISTGIFGFPLHRATDIIVDAVKDYLAENSSTTVREVYFIDNDPRAVASLENKLTTIKVDGPQESPEGKKSRRVVGPTQGSYTPQQNREPPPNISQRVARELFKSASNYATALQRVQTDSDRCWKRCIDSESHTLYGADATQRTRTVAGPRLQKEEQHEERRPQDLSRIILSIYALSQKAIQDVLKDVEEVIKEYIIDKILDSPKDQENVAKLNQEQVKRIKEMTDKFPVEIEVETGRLKRIRIRGPPMAVSSVMDQVHLIFQEAQEKELCRS